MANTLTILSIFRQSLSYLDRYVDQLNRVFELSKMQCSAVWLEGDSTDDTYSFLDTAKTYLENRGHKIKLIKYDCGGPYWASINNKHRWNQLANCWNICLDELEECKYTICVESDLIYDPITPIKLLNNLDNEHHVIYPMLMLEKSSFRGHELFYDIWGFSKNGRKFQGSYPYHKDIDNSELIPISSGGGMIVSTYEHQRYGRFGINNCIMEFPANTKLFMNQYYRIYHPKI